MKSYITALKGDGGLLPKQIIKGNAPPPRALILLQHRLRKKN